MAQTPKTVVGIKTQIENIHLALNSTPAEIVGQNFKAYRELQSEFKATLADMVVLMKSAQDTAKAAVLKEKEAVKMAKETEKAAKLEARYQKNLAIYTKKCANAGVEITKEIDDLIRKVVWDNPEYHTLKGILEKGREAKKAGTVSKKELAEQAKAKAKAERIEARIIKLLEKAAAAGCENDHFQMLMDPDNPQFEEALQMIEDAKQVKRDEKAKAKEAKAEKKSEKASKKETAPRAPRKAKVLETELGVSSLDDLISDDELNEALAEEGLDLAV